FVGFLQQIPLPLEIGEPFAGAVNGSIDLHQAIDLQVIFTGETAGARQWAIASLDGERTSLPVGKNRVGDALFEDAQGTHVIDRRVGEIVKPADDLGPLDALFVELLV